MLPQTSLARTNSRTSSVLTSAPDSIPNGPQKSQKRHPRRAGTAPVLGKSISQLSIPIRSKTLGDVPNLNGRIRQVGRSCFDKGGFADIWLGEFIEVSENKVAVKVLRGGRSDADFTAKLKQRLEREAVVWLQLHHPFIMPFFGTCNNFDHANLELPSLVSPYFPNGNINVYLHQNPASGPLTGLRIMSQTGDALSYLHSCGVVHGDLKGSNIIIDDFGDAKLSDFGISRMLEGRGFTTKTVAGTVRWMAMELLFVDDETVTVESDVWSFGMTILEVLTGRLPFFECKHDKGVLLSVMSGKIPRRPEMDIITDDMWDLLTSCWSQVPKSRPSTKYITEHLWFMHRITHDKIMYQEDASSSFEEDQYFSYDGAHCYPVYPGQPSEHSPARYAYGVANLAD